MISSSFTTSVVLSSAPDDMTGDEDPRQTKRPEHNGVRKNEIWSELRGVDERGYKTGTERRRRLR